MRRRSSCSIFGAVAFLTAALVKCAREMYFQDMEIKDSNHSSIIIGMFFCAMLTGCTTPKLVEQHHHHYYEADTMAVQAAVDARISNWHQQIDSSWTERLKTFSTELYHSFRETEVTTETVTTATDSLGRTLRTEQRTISRDISREQRQMEQRLISSYESRLRAVADSVNGIWQEKFESYRNHWEQSDSASFTQAPSVQGTSPWYRRLFGSVQYFICGVIIVGALWITRRWWLRFVKNKIS